MLYEGKIWLGTGEHPVCLLPQMANRHGLIAGATGTGKTVSLKVLAEGFSDMGVPVFLADIKGDLAGMVQPGTHSDNIANRLTQCGVPTFEHIPDRVLGRIRQRRASRPHDRERNGADAARAADEPQRHAGGRAEHPLPRRG